jgi:hypothetical protein
MEETRFAKLMELADDVEQFRFRNTDEAEGLWLCQMAVKQLAKRFVSAARGIRNKEFQDSLRRIDPEADLYDLYSDLQCLVDRLREIAERPETLEWTGSTDIFVEARSWQGRSLLRGVEQLVFGRELLGVHALNSCVTQSRAAHLWTHCFPTSGEPVAKEPKGIA